MSLHEQHTLAFPTNTATPITPVPIFYIHEGDHPFCLNGACMCHAYEAQLRRLLGGVITGELKLRKAYNGMVVGKGIQYCQREYCGHTTRTYCRHRDMVLVIMQAYTPKIRHA